MIDPVENGSESPGEDNEESGDAGWKQSDLCVIDPVENGSESPGENDEESGDAGRPQQPKVHQAQQRVQGLLSQAAVKVKF